MSHTAELIAVGTELLLGNIANTDAQMISQGLSELGINVFYHTVVGDNPDRVRQAVDIAKKRADILITTGGLGPTCDDLTKVALAQAFGRNLFYHEPSAQRIRDRFAAMGRPVTENNYQQAMIPEGATVLDNDWGTAPGVAFAADGVHVIMLPGPPRECEMMFQHRAVPYLRGLSDGVIASRTVKTFGIGESAAESVLRDLMNALMYESGIHFMNYSISNTAEYGEYYAGPKVINEQSREAMKEILHRIQNGEFAQEFVDDCNNDHKWLLEQREAINSHPIEVTGEKIRSMFSWIKK